VVRDVETVGFLHSEGSLTGQVISVHNDLAKSNVDAIVLPQADKIVLWIKTWKDEIKKQEGTIADSRRNTLNPEQQVTQTVVPEMECTGSKTHEATSALTSECEPTEALNLDLYETGKTTKEIIAEISSQFSLIPNSRLPSSSG
jgi:hypothetical protein